MRVKIHQGGRKPTRATAGSVGYDLHAVDECLVVYGGTPAVVDTGVSVELPPNHEACIRPRSSLSAIGLLVHTGTIDWDYRGTVKVILSYVGDQGSWYIRAGDKIAQLVISPVVVPDLDEVADLTPSGRGGNGFGSSGR